MATLHVTVTQEDIEQAYGRHPHHCMCYRAIKRLLPHRAISVYITYMFIFADNEWRVIEFSRDVAERIKCHADGPYDGGPFEFDLEIPDVVLNEERQGD